MHVSLCKQIVNNYKSQPENLAAQHLTRGELFVSLQRFIYGE